MSKVMGEVIGKNQNAFVESRQILDAVMVDDQGNQFFDCVEGEK